MQNECSQVTQEERIDHGSDRPHEPKEQEAKDREGDVALGVAEVLYHGRLAGRGDAPWATEMTKRTKGEQNQERLDWNLRGVLVKRLVVARKRPRDPIHALIGPPSPPAGGSGMFRRRPCQSQNHRENR